MEMLGLDVVGADETKKDSTKEWFKKLGLKAIPAVADAASNALSDDKPKGGDAHPSAGHSGEESFFSRAVVGPVKVWMLGLGVVAAGGGLYLWKRK